MAGRILGVTLARTMQWGIDVLLPRLTCMPTRMEPMDMIVPNVDAALLHRPKIHATPISGAHPIRYVTQKVLWLLDLGSRNVVVKRATMGILSPLTIQSLLPAVNLVSLHTGFQGKSLNKNI